MIVLAGISDSLLFGFAKAGISRKECALDVGLAVEKECPMSIAARLFTVHEFVLAGAESEVILGHGFYLLPLR